MTRVEALCLRFTGGLGGGRVWLKGKKKRKKTNNPCMFSLQGVETSSELVGSAPLLRPQRLGVLSRVGPRVLGPACVVATGDGGGGSTLMPERLGGSQGTELLGPPAKCWIHGKQSLREGHCEPPARCGTISTRACEDTTCALKESCGTSQRSRSHG